MMTSPHTHALTPEQARDLARRVGELAHTGVCLSQA